MKLFMKTSAMAHLEVELSLLPLKTLLRTAVKIQTRAIVVNMHRVRSRLRGKLKL